MEYGKITTFLILVLLAVALSGCTQPNEEAGVKDQPVKYSKPSSQDTDNIPIDSPDSNDSETLSADNQTNDKTQDSVTFEEDVCSAAEDADVCDTKLEELGIVSRNDCCQIYRRCC